MDPSERINEILERLPPRLRPTEETTIETLLSMLGGQEKGIVVIHDRKHVFHLIHPAPEEADSEINTVEIAFNMTVQEILDVIEDDFEATLFIVEETTTFLVTPPPTDAEIRERLKDNIFSKKRKKN